MRKSWLHLKKWLILLLAITIIVAATCVSIGRLITPYLNAHTNDFEKIASEVLKTPIKITRVYISWSRYIPEITLDGVTVLDKKDHKAILNIKKIKLHLKIFKSIVTQIPVLAYIKISGVDVTIQNQTDGIYAIAGIGEFALSDHLKKGEEGKLIANWVFTQPTLILDNIRIKLISKKEEKSISLFNLTLYNGTATHSLSGRATLNQEIPTNILFKFNWQGPIWNTPPAHASLYTYIEAISLRQWVKDFSLQDLKIKSGLGSAKIWLEWKNGLLTKAESQLQIYDLFIDSLRTQKIYAINRINGKVGWKIEGNEQIFTGNDIYLDLPNHLWPSMDFKIAMPIISPQEIKGHVSYIDLDDTLELIKESTLLSKELLANLKNLNPSGQIHHLSFHLEQLSDLTIHKIAAEFINLSFNNVDPYPGFKNLNMKIKWKDNIGAIELDTKKLGMIWPAYSTNTVIFDRVNGVLKIKKDPIKNWFLETNNFKITNKDIEIKSQLKSIFPAKESPAIDLKADLLVHRAENLINYFPIKIFDRELTRWLEQAFLGGEFVAGHLVFQGELAKDFFNTVNAKALNKENNHLQPKIIPPSNTVFDLIATAKNLDFSYAPGWPKLSTLNGNIHFSGRRMEAYIKDAVLLEMPIKNVSVTIPYIGHEKPGVVQVQGAMQNDMTHGIRYIQESPLQKKFGKVFQDLQVQGLLDLKLNMEIPLKQPEETLINGSLKLQNAAIYFPQWQLTLDKIAGNLFFTEKGMQAKDLAVTFANTPSLINIKTEYPESEPSFIKISLQSKISEELLKSFTQATFLENIIKGGGASLDIDLYLISLIQNPSIKLMALSDLKGIEINLPNNLGKESMESVKANLLIQAPATDAYQVKFNLDKKFSSAISFIKNDNQFRFMSGEVSFGNKENATWQKLPGLIITGKLDSLDLNSWLLAKEELLKQSHEKPTNIKNTELNTENFSLMQWIRGVDFQANKVTGLIQDLSNIKIQALHNKQYWTIDLHSKELAGKILLPKEFSHSAKITANFEYIYLNPNNETKLTETDDVSPLNFPGISFHGKDVHFKDKYLGDVSFELNPIAQGLTLRSLRMNSNLYELNATGQWVVINKKNQTYIKGSLRTNNVAEFINMWSSSSSPNPVGSKGSMEFDLSWPTAPHQLKLQELNGQAKIDIKDGRIINLDESTNAKMGFGKILNLLSIPSLSHVLTFNFSDLMLKGYTFDYMKGSYSLINGNILTTDTKFDGSLAKIAISGRMGLIKKDYDLNLTITPYITGSIPIVAAIAVNPLIGVAAWAVEKMASSAFSGATTRHYTVKGPWDKPVWQEK